MGVVWRCISCPCCFPSPHCLSHDTPHLTDLSGVFKAPRQRLAASHRVASAPPRGGLRLPGRKGARFRWQTCRCCVWASPLLFPNPLTYWTREIKPKRAEETFHLASCPASLSALTSFMQIHVRGPPTSSPSLSLSRARCTRGSLVCVAVVGRNVIILARQGLWMRRRLCLVIRTVNDRDAWGDAEKGWWEGAGGQRERGPLVLPGVGAADLSQTRALLPATIACVVIVLKAWRPRLQRGPPLVCVCGFRFFGGLFFLSFFFSLSCPSLLPAVC